MIFAFTDKTVGKQSKHFTMVNEFTPAYNHLKIEFNKLPQEDKSEKNMRYINTFKQLDEIFIGEMSLKTYNDGVTKFRDSDYVYKNKLDYNFLQIRKYENDPDLSADDPLNKLEKYRLQIKQVSATFFVLDNLSIIASNSKEIAVYLPFPLIIFMIACYALFYFVPKDTKLSDIVFWFLG